MTKRKINHEFALEVKDVFKVFKVPHRKIDSVKGAFVNFYKKNNNICGACLFLAHKVVVDRLSKRATIKLLKPPVLTARHGGVLFLK